MSVTPPTRKLPARPNLGPAPGEPGFVERLRERVVEAELDIAAGRVHTLADAKALIETRLIERRATQKKRSVR
jgi:hypothetical protein